MTATTGDSPPAEQHQQDDVVDAHVHVWHPDRVEYPWLAEVPSLARPFDLADVSSEQSAIGVTQLVLVQAADNVHDTENMLRAGQVHAQVAGVVAWVPIWNAVAAAVLLDRWAAEPVVGVRHLVHRDPDPDLLSSRGVGEVLNLLAERNLTFDVCAETSHLLGVVPTLAEDHADLTLIVDHLGKPPIRSAWLESMGAAASRGGSRPERRHEAVRSEHCGRTLRDLRRLRTVRRARAHGLRARACHVRRRLAVRPAGGRFLHPNLAAASELSRHAR